MSSAEESYSRLYEAPGASIAKASKSKTAAVRKMVADSVRLVEDLPLETLKGIAPAIAEARAELEKGLAKWLKEAPAAGDRFTAHQMRRALIQLREAQAAINRIGPSLGSSLLAGNVEAAGLSGKMLYAEIGRLDKVFGGSGFAVQRMSIPISSELVDINKWLIRRMERSAARYSINNSFVIRKQLQVSVLKGDSMLDMVKRITKFLPDSGIAADWAGDLAKGILRGPTARAERLIRTELSNAYSAHKQSVIKDFAASVDEQVFNRWDASSDRHCILCEELDGDTVVPGEPFSSGHIHPPRHPYCRCVIIPWMEHWPEIKPLKPLDTKVTKRHRLGKAVVTRGGTARETRIALEKERERNQAIPEEG